ncbi:hypothetical protein [Streptomyces nodosus]|uniref:hypothetical protein n=1 Tax=Streptomyces nodosus TaxID=40318 RepID=UPI00381C182A
MSITPLWRQPSWKALDQHHSEIGTIRLREPFAQDPGRGERMCAKAAGLLIRRYRALKHQGRAKGLAVP